MDKKNTSAKTSPITLLGALFASLVLLNILFLLLSQSGAKTVLLLKNEFADLEENEKFFASSNQIYSKYKNEISVISSVFPNERTIPVFVQDIEEKLRATSEEYSFKFNAITPITEQTRFYLPITVVMRSNLEMLTKFLTDIERLPYMTHINSILTKTPDGFLNTSEVTISMKVYVQNPFSIIE